MALLTEQLKRRDRKQDKRGGGVTRSKGPQAGTPTRGHCSEDRASVRGMPAVPTELSAAPKSTALKTLMSGLMADEAKEQFSRLHNRLPGNLLHFHFRVLLTAPPTCHHLVRDVNTPGLLDRARMGGKKRGDMKRRGKRETGWET